MPPERASPAGLPGRWARAFGRFWWDFLVGDTPELLVGAVGALAAAALLAHLVPVTVVGYLALPLLVLVVLCASAALARHRS